LKRKYGGPSVEEVQAVIAELQAAVAPMERYVPLRDAEAALRVALRAEKTPRCTCTECDKRLQPGKPVVARRKYGSSWWLLCVPCDRKLERHEGGAYILPDRQQPCPTCARSMYFRGYVSRRVTCSYQCSYQNKIAKQLATRKVTPQPKLCKSCGKEFTPKRADAIACGNTCRQRLFRLSHKQ
jgi:predicted RNA-binding Zn-ribbon protein involved in translation (DUF1610 family)